MAQKTVFVSDISGQEINGDSAQVTIALSNEPNTRYVLDASAAEVAQLISVAHKQKSRGRPRKKAATAA